ncbi:hypothetical protein HN587_07145 [Candidatus Woesearchaeota archaeon]|jgi:hypothetical protein|nr:hypothetical protein [Candidatus Woesearchaeota archaeon]
MDYCVDMGAQFDKVALTYTELNGIPPGVSFSDDINFVCARSINEVAADASELSRNSHFKYLNDDYFVAVHNFLREMGVAQARIDFIRDSKGEIARGSTRIPLLVSDHNLPDISDFVVKTYDDYSKEQERLVLEKVAGKVAPKILKFGDSIFAEDVLPPEHFSLLDLALLCNNYSAGMRVVIESGAKIYAAIAKCEVNYAHNHFLDEFHIGLNGGFFVTDFGTSHLFYPPDYLGEKIVDDLNDKLAAELDIRDDIPSGDGVAYAAQEKVINPIFYEWDRRRKFIFTFENECGNSGLDYFSVDPSGETAKKLRELDPAILANLVKVVESAENALHLFFERRPRLTGGWVSGWDSLRPYQQILRRTFIESYFE